MKSTRRRSRRGQNFSQVENGLLWRDGLVTSDCAGDNIGNEYDIGEVDEDDEKEDDNRILMQSKC